MRQGIGTIISKAVTPIAGVFGASCYDPITGDLKPESKCAKTRDQLDAAKNPKEFASAIFDRFRSTKTKGDKMAEETQEKKYYTVVVLVQTEKLSDIDVKAIEIASKGEVLAVNPQQAKPQVQFGGPQRPTEGRVITRSQGKAESQSGS